jgi:penicillin amidase
VALLTWRRTRRILLWTLAVVVVLVVVASLAGVWAVRRSFPQTGGELTVKGLSAPVTVYRDDHGIPQVYARTADDLFRAQGYLHAQDRFWEMDFRRHVTAGRLSEMFGRSTLDKDVYLRTMGWRRVAEKEWDLVSPTTREYLTAYAAGVNAWLAANGGADPTGAKSVEYTLLGLTTSGYTIEPWTPVDSLAWLKAMAWDLRGNMDAEMERAADLASGLTREQVDQVFPAYPYDRNKPIVAGGTVTAGAFHAEPAASGAGGGGELPDPGAVSAAVPALADVRTALDALPHLMSRNGPGIGSNSWAIAGSRTATGKPILANDPHLSPSMPGIWYQIGLHCDCGIQVAGFSFSGVPGVVIGHNARVAWGFTNLDPDVTDLYLEKVEKGMSRVGEGWRPLDTRTEVLKVAGGKPVTITVRSTAHGPLLSDASKYLRAIGMDPPVDPDGRPVDTHAHTDPGYAVALRWTALDPGRTADALFALDTAGDWEQFRAAAALFEVPAQNMVYADVDGNIGYQSPGRVPVRGRGDGTWPAPGWDPAYDWKGFIPFAELPSVLNPADGYVVTANQAVVGPAYPNLLTRDWSYGYRSQRIRDMIDAAGPKVTLADVGRMQFDNRNGFAPTLVPALLAQRLTGTGATAQGLLRTWDFQQPAGGDGATGRASAAAAYYNAVWRHLLVRLFDELPADYKPEGNDRWYEVVRGLLAQPDSPWWDVRATPSVEHAPDILRAAQQDAVKELTGRLGGDPTAWRWGDLHQLTLRNATFGTSGIGAVEWLVNDGPYPVSGGGAIVNATGWDASSGGYEVNAVPSMRMLVDLSNLDASRWIQLTGNSGHAFDDHYHDQVDLWRTGRTLPMRWDADAIRKGADDRLTLQP